MKKGKFKIFYQAILFCLLFGMFSLSFLSEHSKKGSFHTDEPGIVLASISRNRTLRDIFNEAAYTAQPPLEYIVREKIYTPLGEGFNIAREYPEFFHRLLSLLWWILPIGYFVKYFNKYSTKNRFVITLALLLITSSEFFRFYLAEVKHYSAISAFFAFMIIILMEDKTSLSKLKYKFLLASSAIPLLHMVSFPFYFLFLISFFINLKKNQNVGEKEENKTLLKYAIIFLFLIMLMYLRIRNISSVWQHPSLSNITNLSYINSYFKWTLDWIFHGTPFYPVFDLVPEIIKGNLVIVFILLGFPTVFSFAKSAFSKQRQISFLNLFFTNIILLWPLTVFVFISQSGMFTGERYSIAILVMSLFAVSILTINLVWYFIEKDRTRLILCTIISGFVFFNLFQDVGQELNLKIDTAENKFVKENKEILGDKNVYLIADNGSYSSAIPTLSLINNVKVNANYIHCRHGEFQIGERNKLNEWLEEHSKERVLLLSAKKSFIPQEDVVWEENDLVLYRIQTIEESQLCDPGPFGECYIRCIKGASFSEDGRSIPGVAPHLDVYRR